MKGKLAPSVRVHTEIVDAALHRWFQRVIVAVTGAPQDWADVATGGAVAGDPGPIVHWLDTVQHRLLCEIDLDYVEDGDCAGLSPAIPAAPSIPQGHVKVSAPITCLSCRLRYQAYRQRALALAMAYVGDPPPTLAHHALVAEDTATGKQQFYEF